MSFAAWAAQYDSHKVLAAEITAARIGDGATTTLYWATDGGQWDGLHNFVPCLQGLSRLRHQAQQLTSGRSLASYGDLRAAVDRSAHLDSSQSITWDGLLSDYALAGRPITLRVGGPGLDWADWARFDLYMGQPSYDDISISIPVLGHAQEAVERLVPPHTYDDTYPESTQGKAIPLCYGRCLNITPVLISENPWVYQCHDPAYGPIQAVDAVYIDGLLQTSGYSLDLAQGTVSFASDPQGSVTLDVHGRVTGAGYIELPGDIAQDIITTFGRVPSADLDSAAFSAYIADVPFPAGLYISRQVEMQRALDTLLVGLVSVWGTTRQGKWTIWRFRPPAGDPVLDLTDIEILGFRVRPEERLYWRVSVAGERNWSPQTSPAAGITPGRRQWLRDAFRPRESSDTDVRSLYPLAGEAGPHETTLAELADCASVAGWWLELFGLRRRVVEITATLPALSCSLGDVVRITRPRFGMTEGWLGRVVGIEEDLGANEIKLRLWG